MDEISYAKGLEGVIANESHICKVDGEKGILYYRGYSVTDLANNCSFEEVTYLLLHEKLPTKDELKEFQADIRQARELPVPVIDMIKSFPLHAHPMELLQSVISYLSGYVKHSIEHNENCNCLRSLHQIAQLASVVAAYVRFQNKQEYIPPRNDLSHGANFLYMLHGNEPGKLEGDIMDQCLTLHAEHGFNVSTFTARVVASSLSTCYSSISSAIGSLYGSLHGGANERVMKMVNEIGDVSKAREYVENTLAQKKKIMGMGHRVYKVIDPRAIIMEKFLVQLSKEKNDFHHYEILKEVQKVMDEKAASSGKPIYPNVDFFSGAVYSLMGLPTIIFTPIFAISRVSGWLAHILEQRKDNRLYRPRCLYTGPQPGEFIPIDQR